MLHEFKDKAEACVHIFCLVWSFTFRRSYLLVEEYFSQEWVQPVLAMILLFTAGYAACQVRLYFDQKLFEEMHQIVKDLAPTVRTYAHMNLTFSFKPGRFLALVPLTEAEEAYDSRANAPCLWSPAQQTHHRVPVTTIAMLRPWFYEVAAACGWTNKAFGPTALKGHTKVDVFTWGLVFNALDKAVRYQHVRPRVMSWICLVGSLCSLLFLPVSLVRRFPLMVCILLPFMVSALQ